MGSKSWWISTRRVNPQLGDPTSESLCVYPFMFVTTYASAYRSLGRDQSLGGVCLAGICRSPDTVTPGNNGHRVVSREGRPPRRRERSMRGVMPGVTVPDEDR